MDLPSTSVDSAMRQKIEGMEVFMREQPQIDIPVRHYFSKGDGHGVYAREISVPAGTLYTGKIHKYEQLNILLKGEASILFPEGARRVTAPYTWVSPPGIKRIVYAHTDIVRTTVHGTNLTDIDEIEEHFIAQTDGEYLQFEQSLLLEESK